MNDTEIATLRNELSSLQKAEKAYKAMIQSAKEKASWAQGPVERAYFERTVNALESNKFQTLARINIINALLA